MIRETFKNTKLCFCSLIRQTDLKDTDEKVIKTKTHLESYCKQENLGFSGNSNIKKSDLNSRGLHLQERGSSKLAKKNFWIIFIEFVLQVIVSLTNLKKVKFALLTN